MHSIKKYLLIMLGTISLVLGFIGIFLPILPTTPFLLLSAFCYIRSSEKLYNWLINHKIFGKYIYNYMTYKAIPKKTKIIAISSLWATLTVSIIFMDNLHIRIFLILVGIGVSIHLLKLKTMDKT
jgi:uncharacterized membrane protein YbaN (DUF454 family)